MIPSSSARPVIVHCHIFKNAGSTFDWSLRNNFGDCFLEYRERRAMPLGGEGLARIIAAHPEVRAISGHSVSLPLAPVPGHRLLPALFIRHPIERAYSIYTFERHQSEDTRGARMARKLTFSEYVSWRLEPENPAVLRNYQTRFCAGILGRAKFPVTDANFRAALELLDSVQLLGVVDNYDCSMVVFEHHLAQQGMSVNLAYVHQNAGRYGAGWRGKLKHLLGRAPAAQPFRQQDRGAEATSRRAAWVLEQLRPELGTRLLEANQHDLRLHQEAQARLGARSALLPDFQQRVAEFHRRCALLVDIPPAPAPVQERS